MTKTNVNIGNVPEGAVIKIGGVEKVATSAAVTVIELDKGSYDGTIEKDGKSVPLHVEVPLSVEDAIKPFKDSADTCNTEKATMVSAKEALEALQSSLSGTKGYVNILSLDVASKKIKWKLDRLAPNVQETTKIGFVYRKPDGTEYTDTMDVVKKADGTVDTDHEYEANLGAWDNNGSLDTPVDIIVKDGNKYLDRVNIHLTTVEKANNGVADPYVIDNDTTSTVSIHITDTKITHYKEITRSGLAVSANTPVSIDRRIVLDKMNVEKVELLSSNNGEVVSTPYYTYRVTYPIMKFTSGITRVGNRVQGNIRNYGRFVIIGLSESGVVNAPIEQKKEVGISSTYDLTFNFEDGKKYNLELFIKEDGFVYPQKADLLVPDLPSPYVNNVLFRDDAWLGEFVNVPSGANIVFKGRQTRVGSGDKDDVELKYTYDSNEGRFFVSPSNGTRFTHGTFSITVNGVKIYEVRVRDGAYSPPAYNKTVSVV